MDYDPSKPGTLPPTLERDLAGVLNKYSLENQSNTPDFILAKYLLDCLAAWNVAVQEREKWYGRAFATGSLHTPEDSTPGVFPPEVWHDKS